MIKVVSALTLLFSNLAFAKQVVVSSTCEVKTVFHFSKTAANFRSDVENILTENGFRVQPDGFLYQREDVTADQLSVREDLKSPGALVAVFDTAFGETMFKGCLYYDHGRYDCRTDLKLYQVDQNNELILVASVETAQKYYRDPSVAKVEILTLAELNLPLCRISD